MVCSRVKCTVTVTSAYAYIKCYSFVDSLGIKKQFEMTKMHFITIWLNIVKMVKMVKNLCAVMNTIEII
jgi:hypothetical protein